MKEKRSLPSEQRIISLLPSATEVVCALGLHDRLVGRSHECDYPPEVEELPICSHPRYRSDGTSDKINKNVEAILREALSIYRVDVNTIASLKPTHIITQSQCPVCAVSTDELRDALCEYLHLDAIDVIDLSPMSLSDVFDNVLRIADALDVHCKGEQLIIRLQASFDTIQAKTGERPLKPRVAHIEWIEPIMVAGHWMMSLITMAGGINVFPDEQKRWIGFEDLIRQNPDKIIIAPCGFSIRRSLRDMKFLQRRAAWKNLRASQKGEVYICDGSHYFNRPGPRLIDSAEILAEIFHPDIFSGKHHQAGWVKLG